MPNSIPPSFPPTGSTTHAHVAHGKSRLQGSPAYLVAAQKKIAEEVDGIEGHANEARLVKSGLLQLEEELKSGLIGTRAFESRFNALAKDSMRVNIQAKLQFLLATVGRNDPRISELLALGADLMSGQLSLDECKARYSDIVKTIDPSPPSKPGVPSRIFEQTRLKLQHHRIRIGH